MELSENAKALEMASKEERIDYVKENHAKAVTMYRRIVDAIGHLN